MKRGLSRVLIVGGALALGCGGKTQIDSGGGSGGAVSGGNGGTAANGGTSASGGTAAFGAVSGGGGEPFGGAGGGAGCGPVDSGAECSTLGETECLAASSRCVPLYDDACCPMCKPTGMCADCVNYEFIDCAPREESSCVPGAVPQHCGQTPSWACTGGAATCDTDNCNTTPGCVAAQPTNCPPDSLCAPECHALTSESCGPACGPPVPMPMCPNNGTHEVEGGKYTGFCLEPSACKEPDGCPSAMPSSGSKCADVGQSCSYGGWCKNTCTCKGGAWACLTPPC
ncbi:MAG: hypothetical protein IPI67_13580 [Myxococcales bacterium]|nr:hypothetical protein [Myxococcales bacterium]